MTKKTKVIYHYIKPKNEEEAKGHIKRVNDSFDILFEAILEEMIKNKGFIHK